MKSCGCWVECTAVYVAVILQHEKSEVTELSYLLASLKCFVFAVAAVCSDGVWSRWSESCKAERHNNTLVVYSYLEPKAFEFIAVLVVFIFCVSDSGVTSVGVARGGN